MKNEISSIIVNDPIKSIFNSYSKCWETFNEKNQLHSFNDQPCQNFNNGTKVWMRNDVYHRIGGPAYLTISGFEAWMQNGQYHRIDGPAIIYLDGRKGYRIKGQIINIPVHITNQEDIKQYLQLQANF